MLQIKELVKSYSTKAGSVVALGGVSVDFPEKGMIFLLGKSGSGKSTLLNVAGGLDSPDSGEVIVKGKSSKNFSKKDFDSYRNTYIGFIFQEYNVLNELTVAENVALALELQGKPRDNTRVNELLKQVDLEGLGSRCPNTLSGGQKQRVAIARALVKNPEIIMADEPTGALDSATGRQVLDTLKKLSEEKLVVIVSHDREFAEVYADRIIELKDGLIISDQTRVHNAALKSNITEYSEKKLTINSGAALSDADIDRIVTFLKRNQGGVILSAEKEDVGEIQTAARGGFEDTVHKELPPEKDESRFIKSKFPLRYSFKMGLSSLKFKPIRLVLTSLLATIAFIVFGVFSTLVTYDQKKIGTKTLNESSYGAAVLIKHAYYNNDGVKVARDIINGCTHILTSDIEHLNSEFPNMKFAPVFNYDFTSLGLYSSTGDYMIGSFYSRLRQIIGFSEASYIEDNSTLDLIAGRLPQTPEEIVISKTVFTMFRDIGYKYGEIFYPENYEEILGRPVVIRGNIDNLFLNVVGIVDTHDDFTEYEYLKTKSVDAYSPVLDVLQDHYFNSFSSVFFVSDDFYEHYSEIDRCRQNYEGARDNYRFQGTNYRENASDGKYYQYLLAPLQTDREARIKTLMGKLNDYTLESESFYFSTPYDFIYYIKADAKQVKSMIPIIGPAAGVLAVFSALLLYNFIAASINAKKKDIGILRAVGARGADIFKIFLVEGLVITFFCFILACLGSYGACLVTNMVMIGQGVASYRFFLFDFVNVLLVFGIAVFTMLFAVSVPVALTVRKKPVEAIRSI